MTEGLSFQACALQRLGRELSSFDGGYVCAQVCKRSRAIQGRRVSGNPEFSGNNCDGKRAILSFNSIS
jgi:hypothetical protein